MQSVIARPVTPAAVALRMWAGVIWLKRPGRSRSLYPHVIVSVADPAQALFVRAGHLLP